MNQLKIRYISFAIKNIILNFTQYKYKNTYIYVKIIIRITI